MDVLISLLIVLLIAGMAVWLVQSVLPIAAPFKTAIVCIIVVIALIYLLSFLPHVAPLHRF